VILTDAGSSIERSDLHSLHALIALMRAFPENITSLSSFHFVNPLRSITSTESGIEIRESDVHAGNPSIKERRLTGAKSTFWRRGNHSTRG
jgi:hypothetical protein